MQDFYGREPKDDKNFVDWYPILVESDGKVNDIITPLEYRKCTESDWDKFYLPSKKNEERVQDMKEKGYMHCLTGKTLAGVDADLNIYGPDETTPHKRLEFLYRPCIPK